MSVQLDWATFSVAIPTDTAASWAHADDTADARGTTTQLPRWRVATTSGVTTRGVAWQVDGGPIVAAIRLAPGAPQATGQTVRAAVAALAAQAPDWFGIDG